MTPQETLAALAAPFADDELEQRPIRGQMFTYPTIAAVVRRLNEVAGLDWSASYSHTLNGQDLLVCARLTIRGPAGATTRAQYGAARFGEKTDPADTCKKAASLALRKAAMQFGVGLYLALPERETDEPGQDDEERQPAEGPLGPPLDASYLAAIKVARTALGWTADQVRDLCHTLAGTRDIEHLAANLAIDLIRSLRAQAHTKTA